MTSSEEYYDPINQEGDFNDSVILRPISLKPSVIPSVIQRGNRENTILGTYDKIKLTEYIESSQQGKVIQLIGLDQNSLITILNPEGIQFLQKYSATDISFVTVTGQKGSGKSFFIDKILNLANFQGNNFSLASNKPGIRIWSVPFVKDEFKFFIAQVSGCSPGSKQFNMLLPYVTILSSVIIDIESLKGNVNKSFQKLNEKLVAFMNQFESQKLTEIQNKAQLLGQIFPQIIFKLSRNQSKSNLNSLYIRTEQLYIPNAKNPDYRGIDEDLKTHSFMNKKCINEQYIVKASQIFVKVFSEVHEKKHRQLVFNGGIILKYLGELSLLFHKGKRIDIGKVYMSIVKDLYLSAYNYCVICYHQFLQQSLSDEKPRSVDELIQIFSKASTQIFQKYNEFSLQKEIHLEYEEKLQKHIESKQRLILEINKKKTDLQLRKIYDQSVDINDFTKVWSQMQAINKKYPTFTHGRDQTMGKKLAQIISRLKTGNNIDYRAMKQIQNLKNLLSSKKQELLSIKESNKKTQTETNQKNRQNQKKKSELLSVHQQKGSQIQKIKKEIQSLQKSAESTDPTHLKNQQQELLSIEAKNQQILKKLQAEANEPIQNNREIKDIQRKIQDIKNKIRIQEMTLQELEANANINQNNQQQQTQMKLKKEGEKKQENANQKKATKVEKNIKDSKGNKKSSN